MDTWHVSQQLWWGICLSVQPSAKQGKIVIKAVFQLARNVLIFSLNVPRLWIMSMCAKQNTFCVYSASVERLSIGIWLWEGCVLLEPSLCSLAWENGDRIRVGTASCLCVCSCAALLMQSSSTCSMVCIQSKHDFTGNKCVGFVLKSFLTVRQGTFIHFPWVNDTTLTRLHLTSLPPWEKYSCKNTTAHDQLHTWEMFKYFLEQMNTMIN